MAARQTARNPKKKRRLEDRYLELRPDGGFRYQRYVPERFQPLVGRRFVKLSLNTSDPALARQRRDAQEVADDEFWASLVVESEREAARRRYEAATARARAMGFSYRPAGEIAAQASLWEIVARVERLEATGGAAAPDLDIKALLGVASTPKVSVTEAFRIYLDDIAAGQKVSKSPAQYRNWLKVKQRAVNNFVAAVGDKALEDITRADAQAFWRFWQDRVNAAEVTPNSAARDFGNMRVLFTDYMKWIDRVDAPNPFRNLSFSGDVTKSRPPFETAWIREKFLQPGPIDALNPQARAIFLALIETGCRPSEIANLRASTIHLDADVPHISIEPERGLEIKTRSSIRKIPLVGVSLAALQAYPEGFPRYFDKPDVLSQTLMKWLKAHDLLPTPKHKVYSLRHSFKKRAQEGGLSDMLIDTIMGHASQKPVYGDGGSLEWRRDQLEKIALPFRTSVV